MNLKVTDGIRKLYMEQLPNLYSMAGIIAVMNLRMREEEHVASMRK